MKNINARTTLKLVLSFSWLMALLLIKNAYAGDYYTYQDPNGNLVISNNVPPPGSKIIKKETLSEVTDQQIAESEHREGRVGFDNRLSSLEKTIGELAENLRVQSGVIENLEQNHGDTNIAVGVTQGPAIVGRPPYNKFNRPPNFRNNLPNRQPRPVVPIPPPPRAGGRAG
jgi:Domain of unknown function (DUF4124)